MKRAEPPDTASRISLELTGCVNNVAVGMTGSGRAEPSAGKVELELDVSGSSMHWDPALLLLSDLDLHFLDLAGVEVKPEPEASPVPILAQTRMVLFDQAARVHGHAVISSQLMRGADWINCRAQFLEARFQMEEEIACVETPVHASIIFLEPARIILTKAASFTTTWGKDYWCLTSSYHDRISECDPWFYGSVMVKALEFQRDPEEGGPKHLSVQVVCSTDQVLPTGEASSVFHLPIEFE